MTQVISAVGHQVGAPVQIHVGLGLVTLVHDRLHRRRRNRRRREAQGLLVEVQRSSDVVAGLQPHTTVAPAAGTEVRVDGASTPSHAALTAEQGRHHLRTERIDGKHVALLLSYRWAEPFHSPSTLVDYKTLTMKNTEEI